MAAPDRIFRQAALDRLSSPEQLDQLMQVTTPKSWMALVAFGALILTALVWGIFGRIADQVHGRGIFLKSDGVFVVTTRGEGTVRELFAHNNDTVTNGQLLAEIAQPELKIKLHQAQTNYDALEASLQELRRSQTNEVTIEEKESTEERLMLGRMLTNYTAQIQLLRDRTNAIAILKGKGLRADRDVLDAQIGLNEAQHQLYGTEVQLQRLRLEQFQAGVRRHQQLAERTDQRQQAMQQLESLSNSYVLNTQVRSPYPGQVLEVMVKPGDLLPANTPIASLQGATNALEARIFLNSSDGKRLAAPLQRPRERSPSPPRSQVEASAPMEALLAPASVKKEEFGLMKGQVKVEEVSPYPVTPQGMLRVLENPTLVAEFSQAGAPIEVTVHLLTDTNTDSGFAWTSGRGPPIPITSGTLCEGTITIEQRPPISLVLPLLKKSLRH
jgi:HlyD family secretion protein